MAHAKSRSVIINEWIAWTLLAGMIVYGLIMWTKLPDQIPIHYNVNGEADGFGPKGTIWLLVIIGGILSLALYYLNRHPQIFNYPIAITDENRTRLYNKAQGLISRMNLLTIVIFAYLFFKMTTAAQGNSSSLGSWFLPTFLILVSVIIFDAVRAMRS